MHDGGSCHQRASKKTSKRPIWSDRSTYLVDNTDRRCRRTASFFRIHYIEYAMPVPQIAQSERVIARGGERLVLQTLYTLKDVIAYLRHQLS
jgi:hypothetical protein